MNEVVITGEIISKIEYRFMLSKKHIAIAKFQFELENNSIIEVNGYDERADKCLQKLKEGENLCIEGFLDGDGKIILEEYWIWN